MVYSDIDYYWLYEVSMCATLLLSLQVLSTNSEEMVVLYHFLTMLADIEVNIQLYLCLTLFSFIVLKILEKTVSTNLFLVLRGNHLLVDVQSCRSRQSTHSTSHRQ